MQNDREKANLSAILVIIHLTKLMFELGREFDGRYPFMKWMKLGEK